MIVPTCNSTTQEGEAGGLQKVRGQPGPQNDTLSQTVKHRCVFFICLQSINDVLDSHRALHI